MKKLKSGIIAITIAGGTVLTPAIAEAAPVHEAKIAAASYCPWWVANGYWRVIWWTFNPGQCR